MHYRIHKTQDNKVKRQLTIAVVVEEGGLSNYVRSHVDTLVQDGLTPPGGISTVTLPIPGPLQASP